jgi:hypothetical protein
VRGRRTYCRRSLEYTKKRYTGLKISLRLHHHHQMVMWIVASSSSSESCWILFSAYYGDQNCHTGDLVEHAIFLFYKVIYSRSDVPSKMFYTYNNTGFLYTL